MPSARTRRPSRQAPEALPAHFRFLLGHAHAGRPLIVFVDALDQLADLDEDSELVWVPAELPPYARLYLSALPPQWRPRCPGSCLPGPSWSSNR